MKSNVIKTPACSPVVCLLCFLISFFPVAAIAATVDQDFAIIQDRLLKNISGASAPYTTTGLAMSGGGLDVAQIPTQDQVNTAMAITSSGLYADLNYTNSNDPWWKIRTNHFLRLNILALAHRNAPNNYTQPDSAISAAIIQGLTAWVNFFPPGTKFRGTVFKDDIEIYPGVYPNAYGGVVLLVPELIQANPDLWSKSITYLTQYYCTSNTFSANSVGPYRAALIGHVLARNSAGAAALTNDYLSRELSFSNRENDYSKVPITTPTEYSKTEGAASSG